MDFKELKALLDDATKALKAEIATAKEEADGAKKEASEAKAKTVEVMNKYEEAKAELEKSASKEMMEALEMRVKSLQEMADTLAIKQNMPKLTATTGNLWEDLKTQFDAKKADLEKFVAAKSGYISLEIKDAVIGIAAFGDRVIFGLREPGVDKVQFRENFIFDLITTINGGPGSNPLSWVEMNPVTGEGIDGAAAWTAESATKPTLKWAWTENKVTAEVLAATAYVTRQATLNWPLLQSEINNELSREIRDVLDDAVINGDGTANSIKGIKLYAKPFDVGTIGPIIQPNDFDVLRAAASQVKRGGAPTDRKRGGFRPTHALVEVDRGAEMDMTKASDGHYVMPPFSTQDGTVVKGLNVVETNFVDEDEFIVGEMRRYLFNFVEGLRIDVGYINDQFVKNQFTIRAEIYGMGRVKSHEAYAFVKGTFTEAKVALAAGAAT